MRTDRLKRSSRYWKVQNWVLNYQFFKYKQYLVNTGKLKAVEDGKKNIGTDGRPNDVGEVDDDKLRPVSVDLRTDPQQSNGGHEWGH